MEPYIQLQQQFIFHRMRRFSRCYLACLGYCFVVQLEFQNFMELIFFGKDCTNANYLKPGMQNFLLLSDKVIAGIKNFWLEIKFMCNVGHAK